MFKVGDIVTRHQGHPLAGVLRTVSEVFNAGQWCNYEGAKSGPGGDYSGAGGCGARYWKLVQSAPQPTSRANDPTTSKGKRKVNKYEQAVLSFLACNPDGTGKEIASGMREPLNCITPRFAPLRRKGLIQVKTNTFGIVKRDKQIVWVLA